MIQREENQPREKSRRKTRQVARHCDDGNAEMGGGCEGGPHVPDANESRSVVGRSTRRWLRR